MKTIHYFCTGGETEVGGMQKFLLKINANINWSRQFPALNKGAKPTRSDVTSPTMYNAHTGTTGKNLVAKMHKVLKEYSQNFINSDGILLIDDADCRFLDTDFNAWMNRLQTDVQTILGKPIPVYVLIASPEVEAWFIADPIHSFEKLYSNFPGFGHQMSQYIKNQILCGAHIEQFGGPCINEACTIKLSNELINIFSDQDFLKPFIQLYGIENVKFGLRYSKKTHGAQMLEAIEPDIVSSHCNLFFKQTYQKLAQL
ncbi:hypothetical protein [Paenibacillus campi]|uniref:hypothetical protein n=1 Tax=Paenibacillus campi TaxID=3106031 RepID=UPI002AFE8C86|nr:hypothetical protein [Paenibacillus sp. SGZ-1009]